MTWKITLTCDIGDPATGDACPETLELSSPHTQLSGNDFGYRAANAGWRRVKGRGWACPKCRGRFE